MKKSIKWKLTVSFIIVIVCCIGSILLFNTLFLEKLYIREKETIIKKSYNALEMGITEAFDMGYTLEDLFTKKSKSSSESSEINESNLARFLRELQENYNVSVVLMDSDNNTYSIFQNNNRFDKRITNYIFKGVDQDKYLDILEKTDNYTIGIRNPSNAPIMPPPSTSDDGPMEFYESEGPGNDVAYNKPKRPNFFAPTNRDADIECFGFLSDNQTAFFITIPVGSIKEPISLFNRTLIVISIFILIIGSIAIFIISNNLVSPILSLAEISKKMSRMEFENKYEGKREDEIGILGNSMNEMSNKLEKAIKELKNANIKLKEDLEQKEQLDMMRQEFVVNVSHELKTPIALIEGYAEGLETPGIADTSESRNYYISVIKDEAEKMNRMVHDLLDLSALERGVYDIEVERIDLKEIVDSIVKTFEVKLSEKDIKLVNRITDSTFVWVDGYKLEQVIRNYLSNAINHIDDNRHIEILVENIPNDKIRFKVFNSGKTLSDDDRERIWEKFYKVDKARTREYGGTGLGLSIVKAIANAHNTICGCENIEISGYMGIVFYFDLSSK